MRILVCGNKGEHEWPELCARGLRALGHDVQVVHYRWPGERDVELLPRALAAEVPHLLQSYEGRRELMERAFFLRARDFRPDLVLLAGIYNTWRAEALADVRQKLGVPIVLWSGDNPYAPGAPDVFANAAHYDLALFANFRFARSAAERFRRTEYVPFGCDPERDHPPAPAPDDVRFRCALSWLGTFKNGRAGFLDQLARDLPELDLRVWGAGFPEDLAVRYPALASVYRREHVWGATKFRLYAASDVVLNLHHTGFANMKLFEVACAGAFQVSNKRLEAEATREALPLAAEVPTWETTDELVQLLEHYLSRPDERAARAARLRELVRAEHTWRHRVATILELAGLEAAAHEPAALPRGIPT